MFIYQKLIDRSTLRQGFQIPVEFHHLLKAMQNLPDNIKRKFVIRIPEERQEFLALSSTDLPNVFVADCVTTAVKAEVITEVGTMAELDFETYEPREDRHAGIKQVTRLQKVRQLDRSIGDSLKLLYDYRCQMTGEKVGDEYNALCVEAHHIIPFTESLNNDTSNIIILSPSYHRIIHKAKPIFDREQLAFRFPNGLIEKVKMDRHLRV